MAKERIVEPNDSQGDVRQNPYGNKGPFVHASHVRKLGLESLGRVHEKVDATRRELRDVVRNSKEENQHEIKKIETKVIGIENMVLDIMEKVDKWIAIESNIEKIEKRVEKINNFIIIVTKNLKRIEEDVGKGR